MNVVLTVVLAAQMLAALGMIGLILVQHGKGADMGAAFGSGGSGKTSLVTGVVLPICGVVATENGCWWLGR